MMLRMNNEGSDNGSWEAGSYVHDDTDVNDDDELYDGTDADNDGGALPLLHRGVCDGEEKHLKKCTDARRVGDWKSVLREDDSAIAAGADFSGFLAYQVAFETVESSDCLRINQSCVGELGDHLESSSCVRELNSCVEEPEIGPESKLIIVEVSVESFSVSFV